MDARPFSLVFGYLPEIDDKFSLAIDRTLNRRFAIVLDSHRPSLGEMYYDWEILFNFLVDVASLWDYDKITVLYNGKTEYFTSINAVRPEHVTKLGPESDYFDQIELSMGNASICIINPEPYYSIGGPAPYHDSFTFAFYLKEYNKNKIVDTSKFVAEKYGYTLQDIIIGNDQPKISLLTRLKRLF